MKRLVLLLNLLPLLCAAQQDLSGLWKLKDRKVIKGPDYVNGIPKLLKISKSGDMVIMEITTGTGSGGDTTYIENLKTGLNQLNQTTTNTGKKKTITYAWDKQAQVWLKKTVFFAKENADKQERIDQNKYSLVSNQLKLWRSSEYLDPAKGDSNSEMEALYEKTTPEAVAKNNNEGRGIQFTEGLSWEQLLAKAKAENKYLFVDCYATWCGPCKQMDREVYSNDSVGIFMNKHFVSVKVQMDTGKNDNENVKLTYGMARAIEKKHGIVGLPTYLFFAPDGTITHRAMGGMPVQEFIQTAAAARQAEQQLYAMVKNARAGKLDYNLMPVLVNKLNEQGEKTMALEVARIYMKGYLEGLDETAFLSPFIVDFLNENQSMINIEDRFYNTCLKLPTKIDAYAGKGFSKEFVIAKIINQKILSILIRARTLEQEPDWNSIIRQVRSTKGAKHFLTDIILQTKVDWYAEQKDSKNYCNNLIKQIDRMDLKALDRYTLNSLAWKVFQLSFDRQELKKAVSWVNLALGLSKELSPLVIDTKANLLYKLGKIDEAIKLQEKACSLLSDPVRCVNATVTKMKKGEPTWPTN